MNKLKEIKGIIDKATDRAKVAMWNVYVDLSGRVGCHIYEMDMLDYVLAGKKPSEIIRLVHFGGLNPTDKWFWYDEAENLASNDWLYSVHCPFNVDDMAEWALKEKCDLCNDDIEKTIHSAP